VLEGAVLEIIEAPGRGRCPDCGGEQEMTSLFDACPCGAAGLDCIGGDEDQGNGDGVMCTTCGCSGTSEASVIEPGHSHDHSHDHHHQHDHHHDHHHHHDHGTVVTLEQQILAKNNLLAERNRGWFAGRGILALNLMSSPGAGKTTLLERTIRDLGESAKVVMLTVTEGDDKPLKNPHMFRAAEVVFITKSDLLPHVDFSIDRCLANLRAVSRSVRSFVLSAITGRGWGPGRIG
jgi:hypothetical protein